MHARVFSAKRKYSPTVIIPGIVIESPRNGIYKFILRI